MGRLEFRTSRAEVATLRQQVRSLLRGTPDERAGNAFFEDKNGTDGTLALYGLDLGSDAKIREWAAQNGVAVVDDTKEGK